MGVAQRTQVMTRRGGPRFTISQVLERIFTDDLDEEIDGESDSETEDIENDETVEDIDASQASTSTRHVQSLHDDAPSGKYKHNYMENESNCGW